MSERGAKDDSATSHRCPDCGYDAWGIADAYVHVKFEHPEGLENV